MSVIAALVTALTADAGVAALVEDRVSVKGGVQKATYPYVTIQKITTGSAGHLDGASNLDWPLMQIDAWADTAEAAENVAEAVRVAIDHLTIVGSPDIYSTFQDQRGPEPDDVTRKFRVSTDYQVIHERI